MQVKGSKKNEIAKIVPTGVLHTRDMPRRAILLTHLILLVCSTLPTAFPFLSSVPISFRRPLALHAGGSEEPSNPEGADWDAILRSLESSYASPSAGEGAGVLPKEEGVSDSAPAADDARAKVRVRVRAREVYVCERLCWCGDVGVGRGRLSADRCGRSYGA